MPTPPFRPTAPLRFALTIALAAPASAALAGAPHYHLAPIEIPGAQGVYAYDINDAGQIVGYYIDENGLNRAFLYDATGAHTLAVPTVENADVFSQAAGINNAGQIVGSIQIMTRADSQKPVTIERIANANTVAASAVRSCRSLSFCVDTSNLR